mgnify:CR=1 FL=1
MTIFTAASLGDGANAADPDNLFVLTLSCPDRRGIVAAVAGLLAELGCNIVESAQFGDADAGTFFMRVAFRAEGDVATAGGLAEAFAPVVARFEMRAGLNPVGHRQRVLLLVSRFGHCLNDLLFRHLARYMQVLSPALCQRLPGRVINIHHSFLPSFKGARPYHQAHGRGVKLIGATAHYVTEDLDEGPIIEQDVARVDHAMSGDDFVSIGRDIEAVVLARAIKWHLEHRVLPNGSRTVVFR